MSQNNNPNEPFPNPMNALVDLNDNTLWTSGMDQTDVPSTLKPFKIKNRHWNEYSQEYEQPVNEADITPLQQIEVDIARSLPNVEGFNDHTDQLRQVLVTFEARHGENTDDNMAYLQNFATVAALCLYYANYNALHAYILYCFIMKSKLYDWSIILQMHGNSAYRRSLVMCFFYSLLQTITPKFKDFEFSDTMENYPFNGFLFPRFFIFPMSEVLKKFAILDNRNKFNKLFQWIVTHKPEDWYMMLACFLKNNTEDFEVDQELLPKDLTSPDGSRINQLARFFGNNQEPLPQDNLIISYDCVATLRAKIEKKYKSVNRYFKKIIDRYKKHTDGWMIDEPPNDNPMYQMPQSLLMKISLPILSIANKIKYHKIIKTKISANRGGKKIKLKKNNTSDEYNFKNINGGWTLLKRKTYKKKKKKKKKRKGKKSKRKRTVKKYRY